MEEEIDVFKIKKGDILVAHYFQEDDFLFKRGYIIFIAKSTPNSNSITTFEGANYSHITIPTIAHIDLMGHFTVKMPGGIGFTISSKKNPNERSKLFRPTIAEYEELMAKLNKNEFRYNKRTKQLEKK